MPKDDARQEVSPNPEDENNLYDLNALCKKSF